MTKFLIIIFVFPLMNLSYGQIPNPTLPTHSIPQPNIPKNPMQQMLKEQEQRIQKQNIQLIQEAHGNTNSRKEVENLIQEEESKRINYEFPPHESEEGTELYRQAYGELLEMLQDKKKASLKRAVFVTENAYMQGTAKYSWYLDDISSSVNSIKRNMEKEGYRSDNDMAKKMLLHQFVSDTTYYTDEAGKRKMHLPYRYDFKDIFGKGDWRQMFVTKLLSTGTGQCHSMPLLYLILAEELGVDAWLTFSPEHSYVRLQDEKKDWYNLEMTNGHYSTDSWIFSSGFIKSEALRNGIYMDTLSKKETIAYCMADLAKGYAIKYGLDNFVSECLDRALEYHPNNIHALQLKSDYHSYLFQYVVHQLGYPKPNEIHKYPKANEILLKRNGIYNQIDNMGYESMPEEVYMRWLKSLETQKDKQAKFPRA